MSSPNFHARYLLWCRLPRYLTAAGRTRGQPNPTRGAGETQREGREKKHTQPYQDVAKFKTKTKEGGPCFSKAFFINLSRLTPPAADGATSAAVAPQTPLLAGAASLPHRAPRRASPAGSPSLSFPVRRERPAAAERMDAAAIGHSLISAGEQTRR